MDCIAEITTFLNVDRLDVKTTALSHLLHLTGTKEERATLSKCQNTLKKIIDLLKDSSTSIKKDAAMFLINMSGDEVGAKALLSVKMDSTDKGHRNIMELCLGSVLDKDSELADHCCKILSNLSHFSSLIDKNIEMFQNSQCSFDTLLDVFTAVNYNTKGANLHYLGPILSNLTQSPAMREFLMDRQKCNIQRVLPFTEYKGSVVRRGGAVGTIRNCTFDEKNHEWLLHDLDILSHLLLPLAGPEEFDEEDTDKLPDNLQYLPKDKEREEDPDIRIMLMEALVQLAVSRKNREFMREKNAYVILREYHKFETDAVALDTCENLVNILIRTEEEIGAENFRQVSLSEEFLEKCKTSDNAAAKGVDVD